MCTKRCPTCGSTWLASYLNFTFLCGLGLLLLFLCYLMGIPFPPWKTKPTQKHQGRAKRRRKGGTLKDYRSYQREVEKTQKLISVLRSAFGRHHDTIHFRQLLCPDPSCEVCNSTTAEIHQLLFPKALEDFTPSASTAPMTSSFTLSPDSPAVPPGDLTSASLPEPCPPPASIFSPNPVSPLADFFPPSLLGDSLPPEPFPPLDSKFPVDHFLPPLRAFPPIPDDQEKDNNDTEKDNNDLENGQGHNLENGLNDYLLSDPGSSSDNHMVYDSEKELRSPSEENSTGSVKTISQQQFENVPEIHLNKKSEEINEGQLPGTVHESWHAMKQTLLLSVKSHTEIKQRSLPPSEIEDYSLNTFWKLVSVESTTKQILEAHIEKFHMRMRLGLLPRVLESTELFKLIEATSHSSFSSSNNRKDVQKIKDGRQTLPIKRDTIGNTCLPKPPGSHAGARHVAKDETANSRRREGMQPGKNMKTVVHSKHEGFNSLRGSLTSLLGDKARTANSALILDCPLPATSTVIKEEQRILRQSRSSINHQFAEDVQRIKGGRQTLPVKRDTIGKTCPPKPPTRHTGARHVSKEESANSSGRGGMQQGIKRKNVVHSKPEGFNSLRGSLTSLHGYRAGTANSAPILDCPLRATSTVHKEEQRIPRQSPSNINHQFAEDVQRIKGGRQTLPVKRDTWDNTCPPNLPRKHAGARHEPKEESVNSSVRGGMQQGKKRKNPELVVPTLSREIFRAKELDVRQPQTRILTTSKSVSSQIIKRNEHQVKTTVPRNVSVPQVRNFSILTEQHLDELMLMLENREHSWAQVQCTGLPPASYHSTYKASLTHAQGVSNGNSGASQVMHIHPEDKGLTMEQQQEPCFPKNVLRKCQSKNPLPAAVTMSPPDSKAHELGGGYARLRTCQPRRNSFPTEDMALKKRFPTQDVALKVKLGSKPSHTLSQTGQLPLESTLQKVQSPPKSCFWKKVKHFLQCLTPGTKRKRQENSQEKRSPPTAVESRGLLEGRTAFTGMTEAQKILTDGGKFLEEKMVRRHAIDSTCPQQSISSPAKSGKTRQKAQVQAQAQPVQGLAFQQQRSVLQGHKYQAPPARSSLCSPSPNRSIRQIRDKGTQTQKAVAFKDQLLHPKHPLSMPHKKPLPYPYANYRHQAHQGPWATHHC